MPSYFLNQYGEKSGLGRVAQAAQQADEALPGTVCLFPAYAQTVNDCHTYWAQHRQTAHVPADTPLLGMGLAGPRRWVNGLTGSLALWR